MIYSVNKVAISSERTCVNYSSGILLSLFRLYCSGFKAPCPWSSLHYCKSTKTQLYSLIQIGKVLKHNYIDRLLITLRIPTQSQSQRPTACTHTYIYIERERESAVFMKNNDLFTALKTSVSVQNVEVILSYFLSKPFVFWSRFSFSSVLCHLHCYGTQ